MPIYNIDSDIWVRPSAYAQERKVNRQKVNYWIKNNLVEFREYKDLDLLLIRRGSERGVATIEETPIHKVVAKKPVVPNGKLPLSTPARSTGKNEMRMKQRKSIS